MTLIAEILSLFAYLFVFAIGMGASVVRVGFEDSVYYAPGKAARTNAELVERMVSLIHQIGYEAASCDEAREILQIATLRSTGR